MSVELRIKSKHLSIEAQIIRFEECKLKKQVRWSINQHLATGSNDAANLHNIPAYGSYVSLNHHRRWDVRNENRATFLARAYIEGCAYASVEAKRKPENEYRFKTYILPRVVSMVAKYGKSKVPLKIYVRGQGNIDNPELAKLKADILTWSTTSEAKV